MACSYFVSVSIIVRYCKSEIACQRSDNLFIMISDRPSNDLELWSLLLLAVLWRAVRS